MAATARFPLSDIPLDTLAGTPVAPEPPGFVIVGELVHS